MHSDSVSGTSRFPFFQPEPAHLSPPKGKGWAGRWAPAARAARGHTQPGRVPAHAHPAARGRRGSVALALDIPGGAEVAAPPARVPSRPPPAAGTAPRHARTAHLRRPRASSAAGTGRASPAAPPPQPALPPPAHSRGRQRRRLHCGSSRASERRHRSPPPAPFQPRTPALPARRTACHPPRAGAALASRRATTCGGGPRGHPLGRSLRALRGSLAGVRGGGEGGGRASERTGARGSALPGSGGRRRRRDGTAVRPPAAAERGRLPRRLPFLRPPRRCRGGFWGRRAGRRVTAPRAAFPSFSFGRSLGRGTREGGGPALPSRMVAPRQEERTGRPGLLLPGPASARWAGWVRARAGSCPRGRGQGEREPAAPAGQEEQPA